MFEKIKPICVLALVAAIISGLVIVVYNFTYEDTSDKVTDKQAAAVVQIYGGTKDDYEVVKLAEDVNGEKVPTEVAKTLEAAGVDVAKIIKKKDDGSLAFEFLVKGYKSGFDIMVGVKDGKVAGVAIVSVGEETPGLGTNTNKPEFLDQFKGIDKKPVIKTAPKDGQIQLDGVTGATLSSKGVATAVSRALDAYKAIGATGGEAQ